MADYKVTDTELTSIANAIRTKTGGNAPLAFPTGFTDAISSISSGGVAFATIDSGGDSEISAQYITNALFSQYSNVVGISTALDTAALADNNALGVFTVAFAYTTDVKKHFKLVQGWQDHFTAWSLQKSGNQIGVANADFIGSYYCFLWN